MRLSIISILVLCAFGRLDYARAHDQWADGSPVASWVKAQCCGERDAHHLRPDQVHQVDGGYRVDGHDGVIPLKDVSPSQDGDYWIFAPTDWTGGSAKIGNPVRCFFIPLSY